jgi:hypothetical protein
MKYRFYVTTNNNKTIPIGLRVTKEEIEILDWLMKKTRNSRSGVLMWAAGKAAEEMGYKPAKQKA